MTEATHEDTTVITSNIRTSKPNQDQYKHPTMSFKPKRMISFKHEPLKNGNIIGVDIEIYYFDMGAVCRAGIICKYMHFSVLSTI